MPEGLSQTRLGDRCSLLSQIENSQRALDEKVRRGSANLSAFRDQAARMLTSGDAKRSFDLSQESDKTRDRYGRNEYGESILLARRLVEAGVRMVTMIWEYITPSGDVANVWDNHGGTGSLWRYRRLRNAERKVLPTAARSRVFRAVGRFASPRVTRRNIDRDVRRIRTYSQDQ